MVPMAAMKTLQYELTGIIQQEFFFGIVAVLEGL